ncbi:MAG: hypothetical protein HYV36_00735 [Lentisphaerae bacterium]|nr:hypothetical protein [Lentisphaerota bacterium]
MLRKSPISLVFSLPAGLPGVALSIVEWAKTGEAGDPRHPLEMVREAWSIEYSKMND